VVGPGLDIKDACKTFVLGEGRTVVALARLNLLIRPGTFVVLMGPNGAGKTTLFRAIDGSMPLDAGSVEWTSPDTMRIVHVTQDPLARTFSKLSVAEHFLLAELDGIRPRLMAPAINEKRRRRYVALLLEYEREDLVPFLDRPLAELSGGMRQAVSLLTSVASASRANGGRPMLLLLDEPTASLSVTNEQKCLDLIQKMHANGATILLVTHDPFLASKWGDSLVLIHRGRVANEFREAQKASLGAAAIGELLGRLVGDFGGSQSN
jgi:ABC-type uncharacterized transport system ATPase component